MLAVPGPHSHIHRVPPFMTDAVASALADRYLIEREIGRGGMATVYLAQDRKHQRQVAVKVLRPELAAAVGRERFLLEVTTTASLRHPHILPLFDSGEAGGFLFYVMPFVEGESLAARMAREGQLPVDQALGIASEVADALDHAHAHGIVHRDIKPANILLDGGHAVVADFGIARAITAAGTEGLTATGLSIGTPMYMSPEQGMGDKAVDGRSDQYALACVLYEMLAGEPPFKARTPQAILAQQLTGRPPPLRTVRESVPPELERAIGRALSKSPADRFSTTREFAGALQVPGAAPAETAPRTRKRAYWIGAAAVIAAILALTLLPPDRSPAAPLDPDLMAVFPFRVSGTAPGYDALREGMVDFMEVKFSGAGGVRVVPARTSLAASRGSDDTAGADLTPDEARSIARRIGAGSIVLGTVVTTPGHLILSGTLVETEHGNVRGQAKVEGAPDSLHSLIDHFAAQLVALEAGERPDRLASLTSASLPALYAYLAGKAAHRVGQYDTAAAHFARAFELDSTFASAALAYRGSAGWINSGGSETIERATRIAWEHRARLSRREQVLLRAITGSRYPEEPGLGERIAALEAAVREVPDDPDLWVNLGDQYFHVGTMTGLQSPYRLARDALNRALALDTALNVEPMIHLLQIAGMERDTTTLRRLLDRIPDDEPRRTFRRLQGGAVLGDSAMLLDARAHFNSDADLHDLLLDAQLFDIAIQEAERASAIYLGDRTPRPLNPFIVVHIFGFRHNLGRPEAAESALAALEPSQRNLPLPNAMIVFHTIFGYESDSGAVEALRRLAPFVDGPVPVDPAVRREQQNALCVREWWRVRRGQTATARSTIARLSGGGDDGCAVLLEALLAAAEHHPQAATAFARLDSVILAGTARRGWAMELARWHASQGDHRAAHQAARRRGYQAAFGLAYALREEGRVADLAGDRNGAIDAYSHYLALRYNPEAAVKPEVDAVRSALTRLVADRD